MNKQPKTIEIEVKVKIENPKKLLDFLKKSGKFVASEHQLDTYFTPFHRNFVKVNPIKEWLRLRDSDGRYSINYKNWYYEENGESNYCDEYESQIAEYEKIKLILEALDMKQLVAVDKQRQIWIYKDYEIAVDRVKNLRSFVEIEYKGDLKKQSPAQITQQMLDFLTKLGCGTLERFFQGYPHQLLFK